MVCRNQGLYISTNRCFTKTEHQLSFVEQNNPILAEMVLTGEISIKRVYQEIKKIDSPNGIDIKKDLDDLEVLLKKLFPNIEYSQMEKILKRIFEIDINIIYNYINIK